ncbi:hypothetical protein QBC44DRAFT_341796 [Cladorrhinum sp. PSN332]|nr:hypothetical protein QBC44DRAFT_341796 [Cladorrhinum sp. PSN332]
MESPTPTVFVSGATGNVGGVLATLLQVKYGWRVKASARRPEPPRAKVLAATGVQVLSGDWDDLPSLAAALSGCEKLFLCTATHLEDPNLEKVQALNVINAARYVGSIKQVVACTSVGLFDHHEGGDADAGNFHSPFFDKAMRAKRAAEQAVSANPAWHWTLLRPPVFMTNFLAPQVDWFYPGFRSSAVWRSTMTPESRLALILPIDIAKIAAAVLERPEEYHGRCMGVAADLLTVQEMLEQLGGKTGRSYAPHFMSDEEIEENRDSICFTVAEKSLRRMADSIDLRELKCIVPDLTSFEAFLDLEEEAVIQTYNATPK